MNTLEKISFCKGESFEVIKNAMTKKAIFEKLKGQKVKRYWINYALESDNEKLKQDIINSIIENAIEYLEETSRTYSIQGYTRVWRKSNKKQGETIEYKLQYKDLPKVENMIIFENGYFKQDEENKGILYILA